MPHVITEPDAVTPEWLTTVLRRECPDWDGNVTAVDVEFTKALPYSRVARLKVNYSNAPRDKPPQPVYQAFRSGG